jgi:hypothetical protein
LGYDGTCRYNHKKDISEVSFRIFVEAELGTAAEKRKQNLEYFVAIPSFYPKKEGKNIFKIELDFPKNMDLVRFRDKEIEIKIPIKDGKTPQDIDVYYGFQLTKDELLYNRLMRK